MDTRPLDREGEPCDTCPTGVSKFTCWDGKRRCQKCIAALARAKGWDR